MLSNGQELTLAYGKRMPRCQSCKTDLPADQLETMAAAGGSCACGKHIRVREATPLAARMVPGARWLVDEGTLGADGSESVQAREPIMFACMSCGGGLEALCTRLLPASPSCSCCPGGDGAPPRSERRARPYARFMIRLM